MAWQARVARLTRRSPNLLELSCHVLEVVLCIIGAVRLMWAGGWVWHQHTGGPNSLCAGGLELGGHLTTRLMA